MRGVKQCFVCRKARFTRQRHNRKKIRTAINKLKAKKPTTLHTVEDLDAVYDIDEAGDEQLTNGDSNCLQWWNTRTMIWMMTHYLFAEKRTGLIITLQCLDFFMA